MVNLLLLNLSSVSALTTYLTAERVPLIYYPIYEPVSAYLWGLARYGWLMVVIVVVVVVVMVVVVVVVVVTCSTFSFSEPSRLGKEKTHSLLECHWFCWFIFVCLVLFCHLLFWFKLIMLFCDSSVIYCVGFRSIGFEWFEYMCPEGYFFFSFFLIRKKFIYI